MPPTIPKPGTYPRLHPISEASKGTSDPAYANWDRTFGSRTCGACRHYPGAGLTCEARKPERLVEQSGQDACFSAFERAPEPSCAGEEMMPVEEG